MEGCVYATNGIAGIRQDMLSSVLDPATEYGAACMGALVGIGILLMLVGFALVAPRGAGSGSVSHRNIRIAPTAFTTTRGYGNEPSKRARIGIRLVGLAMLAGGLLMIALASH